MTTAVIDHLRALVAIDTTNPPRDAGRIAQAVSYAESALEPAGFDCWITDLGDGCMHLLAIRGEPSTLVNCHLDTVPAAAGWEQDPLTLTISDDCAYGLGACDVKGSAAAILTAAAQTAGDAAILFTTDEEAGQSACVRTFLAESSAASTFKHAVICEPSTCRIISEHRGLRSAEMTFKGDAGHASAGAQSRSAVHDAVRWSAGALDWSAQTNDDSRLAIGVIEGGVKSNMIAESARVRFAIRNKANSNASDAMNQLRSLANGMHADLHERFVGPALAPGAHAERIAASLGVELAEPVDFWTEAALFAEAGIPSVVFGPGSIEHAHSASERVPLADLDRAVGVFSLLFSKGITP